MNLPSHEDRHNFSDQQYLERICQSSQTIWCVLEISHRWKGQVIYQCFRYFVPYYDGGFITLLVDTCPYIKRHSYPACWISVSLLNRERIVMYKCHLNPCCKTNVIFWMSHLEFPSANLPPALQPLWHSPFIPRVPFPKSQRLGPNANCLSVWVGTWLSSGDEKS